MDGNDWTWLLGGLLFAASGLYIMCEPRRLFSYKDDPAEYRPEAVEYDSEQGRFLRRSAPFYLVGGLLVAGVAFL